MSRKEALSQFINQIHGRPVVVKLNSGVDYRGKNKNIRTIDRLCCYTQVTSHESEHLSLFSLSFGRNFILHNFFFIELHIT